MAATGKKSDKGKPRWTLLPLSSIELVIEVLEYGAAKRGDHNWQHLENARTRFLNAAFRHLSDYAQGETLDHDSGLPHLAHAACNCLFLLWHEVYTR